MNKKVVKKLVLKKKVKRFINKLFLLAVLTLTTLIVFKQNPKLEKYVKEKYLNKNIKFTALKNTYEKYIGNIFTVDKKVAKEEAVFKEKLSFEKDSSYKDGVSLTVERNYLVPAINSGIVIFIGEKENYNKSIIIEQIDGINVLYGNIDNETIKLYDYVEKGKLIGETRSNKLYLTFQKDGKYLDYQKYI